MFESKNLLTLIATMSLIPAAGATTVFNADFDGSTAVSGSVTANASVSNLDAGTSVGSWSLTGSGGGNPGAIVANGAQDNNALLFDENVSGGNNNRVRGTFSNSIDLAAGEGLQFSIDFYAARQTNSNREVRLSLDNSSNAKAYVVMFDMDNTKNFDWLDSTNTTNGGDPNGNGVGGLGATTGINTGFTNPLVDGHLSWGSGTMSRLTITIPGALDNTTVAGNTGALATIDWDGDGIIEAADGDVENVAFGPRTADLTDLASFELFYGGTATRGAWIDNINAQSLAAVPEPGSLALLGFGGLCMMARRRKD
jgi:hypothetical protein